MDEFDADPNWAAKNAFGSYFWISTTWWYHQKFFTKNKNALNLAFFSAGSFISSVFLVTMMSTGAQHQAYANMAKAKTPILGTFTKKASRDDDAGGDDAPAEDDDE